MMMTIYDQVQILVQTPFEYFRPNIAAGHWGISHLVSAFSPIKGGIFFWLNISPTRQVISATSPTTTPTTSTPPPPRWSLPSPSCSLPQCPWPPVSLEKCAHASTEMLLGYIWLGTFSASQICNNIVTICPTKIYPISGITLHLWKTYKARIHYQ